MKKGMLVFTAPQVAALRMSISFIFLIPVALKNIKHLRKDNWIFFLAVGLLGNSIPAFLFTAAQTGISSSLTGILNALTPLFTLVLGLIFFSFKTSVRQIAGICLGLIGAILLIISAKGLGNNSNYLMGSLVVAATFLYGISVNVIRYKLSDIPSMAIASLAFLLVGPINFSLLFVFDFPQTFMAHQSEALIGLGYISILAVFGTALAVIIYNQLIKETGALFASSVTYLIPVVAILWGVLDGEILTAIQIMFVGVILGGVYLVNSAK